MLPDIRIHKLILLRQTYKKNKDDIKPGSLISSFISIKCKALIKTNKPVLFVFPYPQSLPITPNLRIFNYLTRIIPTITPVLFVFPPIDLFPPLLSCLVVNVSPVSAACQSVSAAYQSVSTACLPVSASCRLPASDVAKDSCGQLFANIIN